MVVKPAIDYAEKLRTVFGWGFWICLVWLFVRFIGPVLWILAKAWYFWLWKHWMARKMVRQAQKAFPGAKVSYKFVDKVPNGND